MSRQIPLRVLEEEERRAHTRLRLYRVRLYSQDQPSLMASLNRLHKLERDWEIAAKRLDQARERTSARP